MIVLGGPHLALCRAAREVRGLFMRNGMSLADGRRAEAALRTIASRCALYRVVRGGGVVRRGQDDGAYDPERVHGPRFSANVAAANSGSGGKVAGAGSVTTIGVCAGAVAHG